MATERSADDPGLLSSPRPGDRGWRRPRACPPSGARPLCVVLDRPLVAQLREQRQAHRRVIRAEQPAVHRARAVDVERQPTQEFLIQGSDDSLNRCGGSKAQLQRHDPFESAGIVLLHRALVDADSVVSGPIE